MIEICKKIANYYLEMLYNSENIINGTIHHKEGLAKLNFLSKFIFLFLNKLL